MEVTSALALANASLGREARAHELLEALAARGDLDVYARYDIAAARVRLGEREPACAAVQALIEAGYPPDLVARDASFTIMENERWCE